MARRDESILNLLVECPWWVSVLVSGIAFVVLKFVFPYIDFGGMAANAFVKGLSQTAPFVAFFYFLPRLPR
jgi:restriction system protein